jgi:hypothetical protein
MHKDIVVKAMLTIRILEIKLFEEKGCISNYERKGIINR